MTDDWMGGWLMALLEGACLARMKLGSEEARHSGFRRRGAGQQIMRRM